MKRKRDENRPALTSHQGFHYSNQYMQMSPIREMGVEFEGL